MKIAICISTCVVGGVTNSTSILYKGFKAQGLEPKIIVTSRNKGGYFEELKKQDIEIKAVAEDKIWLKDRLDATFEALKDCDVVLNNHSQETWLLLPRLPDRMVKLSVIRGVTRENIRDAVYNSEYLDALIGVSPVVQSLLLPRARCPVEVIPNSVTAQAAILPQLDSKIRVTYLGRLSQTDKNILLLPEIIEALHEANLDYEFEIIGDGPDRARLVSMLEARGLVDNVRFLGEMDYSEAEKRLKEAHFMVMPSNHESFGLTLVEAMALGVIPVVSPLPVFSWILGDCAPALQGGQYAGIIKRLSLNPDEYQAMQRELMNRQQNEFTPLQTVQKYRMLIERVAAEKESGTTQAVFRCGKKQGNMPMSFALRSSRMYFQIQKTVRKIFKKGV